MATNMNESDLKNLREMFIKIDEDMNGQITVQELHDFMMKMKLDDKGSGDIS